MKSKTLNIIVSPTPPPSWYKTADLIANKQIVFILSRQNNLGAIYESYGGGATDTEVWTRDIALASMALTMSGHLAESAFALGYLESLTQGSSYFTTNAGGAVPSPPAFYQVYDGFSHVYEQSLRGEDQGMALTAFGCYYTATQSKDWAASVWTKVKNCADFITYLQSVPESGHNNAGKLRHGDNYEDSRVENQCGSSTTYCYWPYWPEYYCWEEENMRMIMGLKNAVNMANALGFTSDAQTWQQTINKALPAMTGLETTYNKWEVYDWLGSVLWGFQSGSTALALLNAIPSGFRTPYGLSDRPNETTTGVPDTIDYMTSLFRTKSMPQFLSLFNTAVPKMLNSSGVFYDTINNSDGSPASSTNTIFGSARWVYLNYVLNNYNNYGTFIT